MEVDAYTAKNITPFVSSLDEAIDYLQSRASMYRKGLIPKEDQALRTALKSLRALISNLNEMSKAEKASPSVTLDSLIPHGPSSYLAMYDTEKLLLLVKP